MAQTNRELKADPVLVSVVIPAYNAAAHIGAALESVFAQTFTDFEVIVVNDGSSDHERLQYAILPYLDRIIYLSQENRGPSAARNLAIHHARGELLAFLDSDDTWLPEYLSEQTRLLQADPSLDMIYCDALLVGHSASASKTFMDLCPSTGPVTFESLLMEQTQVITSGTVVHRQKVLAAGLFDERFRCAEDHDLWLRIAYYGGKIAYHREVLLRRLVRPGSLGFTPGNLIAGQIEVLKKLDRELALSPEARSILAAKLRQAESILATIRGKRSLLAGDSQSAYESLSLANGLSPALKLRILLISLRSMPRATLWAARTWCRLNGTEAAYREP
jgi:glycosyltransferase involved in cell wall biosynthesis